MKQILLALIFFTFLSITGIIAQTSADASGIAIQGIARNVDNTAMTNSSVNLTFQLYYLNSSNLEETVYTETLSLTTDAFGVFSHVIDPGSVNNAIIANNQVYLRITEGATVISNEKLKHVPYAISANNGVPTGSIMPFIGTTAPAGWVLCNGQSLTAVPGAANLIQLLGSNNAPNLQGMFLRGTGTNPTYNQSGPALNATQDDTYASHSHGSGSLATSTAGAHNHDSNSGYDNVLRNNTNGSGSAGSTDFTTGEPDILSSAPITTDGAHTHTISGNTANSGSTETRPINYGVNYIIKL